MQSPKSLSFQTYAALIKFIKTKGVNSRFVRPIHNIIYLKRYILVQGIFFVNP